MEYVSWSELKSSYTDSLHRFIQDFKRECQSTTFKHKDFWDRVKAVGMSISLITDKEADKNEGYSEYSELQSVQVRILYLSCPVA